MHTHHTHTHTHTHVHTRTHAHIHHKVLSNVHSRHTYRNPYTLNFPLSASLYCSYVTAVNVKCVTLVSVLSLTTSNFPHPITCHHSPSLTITHHHLPSLAITHHLSPSLTITHHHLPSFSITHHHFPSLTITHHLSPSLSHLPLC